MTLFESMAIDAIRINFDEEIVFGSDQAFICTATRFPTVNFSLTATVELCKIADRLRAEHGYAPILPDEKCRTGYDAWYDFYVGINGFDGNGLDSCIVFCPENAVTDDNEQVYHIDLNLYEQQIVYSLLDRQCRERLKKGCDELLSEAREKMKAHEIII